MLIINFYKDEVFLSYIDNISDQIIKVQLDISMHVICAYLNKNHK